MPRKKKPKTVSFKDPEFRKRFDEGVKYWEKKLKPSRDASLASERITEKDLRIVINARA
jgi:hypothetical protein